jgi:hypothetical protein
MAKSKYIMHQCAYCRRDTKMEFVGNQPSDNNEPDTVKVWYRCCKCKHSALLTLSISYLAKKSSAVTINRDECTLYAKEKTFSVGEHIYHNDWDDVGKVIKKDKMSNGIHSIVVSFEKLGERKLLENIKFEETETI